MVRPAPDPRKWGMATAGRQAYFSYMGTELLHRQALTAVERTCARADDPDELLAELSDVLHKFVPHEGSAWFGIDPTTMIATTPSRVEHLDPDLCDMYWHLEFHEEDPTLYVNLARGHGAGALHQMLDGRVSRSVRYRELVRPQGYEDELRGVFRSGGATWGSVSLYRDAARPRFTDAEVDLLTRMGEPIADALRNHVKQGNPWLNQPSAPGLVVIDRDGRAMSANGEATAWLSDIWPEGARRSSTCGFEPFEVCREDAGVPTPLYALVARARAVADGRERAPARLRMRDRRGRWLVIHASVMRAAGSSSDEPVALVIEAAKSAEIAPIIIEAYGLTKRERDVLSAIARGGTTAEIAAELFLSPHTVRDYVKAVFDKLGVSSRGELVAKLFGEHYSDRLHETMVEEH